MKTNSKFSIFEEFVPVKIHYDRVAPYPYKAFATVIFDMDDEERLLRVPTSVMDIDDHTVSGLMVGSRDDEVFVNFPTTDLGHNTMVIKEDLLAQIAA